MGGSVTGYCFDLPTRRLKSYMLIPAGVLNKLQAGGKRVSSAELALAAQPAVLAAVSADVKRELLLHLCSAAGNAPPVDLPSAQGGGAYGS